MGIKIKVRYFGRLTDLSGLPEEEILLENEATTEHLLEQMEIKYPSLKKEIKNLALNGLIIRESKELREGDEIDLFPPFAGG